MKWMRFRVRTNTGSEDIVISSMADIGLLGCEIEDKVPLSGRELEELFIDEAPIQAIADDDGREDLACLNFYVEIAQDDAGAILLDKGDGDRTSPETVRAEMEEVLEDLRSFSDIGDGTITVSVTEDIDWRDNWKQYFHRFFIDDILVLPSWEKPDEEEMKKAAHVLRIDPGAAFGTGLHETTRLAVRAMRQALDEMTDEGSEGAGGPVLLDVGTGSGVLSIIGLMCGAERAVGIDLDPLAVTAACENRERNGYAEADMKLFRGDIIGDAGFRDEMKSLSDGGYDIVVANILPNVLIPLTPVIPELLKNEGRLVFSGILTTKIPEVSSALEYSGFEITGSDTIGEWSSLTACRASV